MECVIQLIELASGEPDPDEGRYVKDYDPAAFEGRGELMTTSNKAQARRFPDAGSALDYYRQAAGVRADGRPNRPMTAWTVDIQPVD